MRKTGTIIVRLLTLVTVAFCVVACDFTEDCSFKGPVKVFVDYSAIDSELREQIPDSMQTNIAFISQDCMANTSFHRLRSNPLYLSKAVGEYDVLYYSMCGNREILNIQDPFMAVISSPTYFLPDGRKSISAEEKPLFSAEPQGVIVEEEDSTELFFTARPVGKYIIMYMKVEHLETGKVLTCTGTLEGVSTSYRISDATIGEENVAVRFSMSDKDVPAGYDLTRRLSVPGIHKGSNNCCFDLTFSNATPVNLDIDLTDVLEKAQRDVIILYISADLTPVSPSIGIDKWEDKDWDDIGELEAQ